METAENIKEVVREKYAAIVAQTRQQNASSCCGVGASCAPEGMDYTVFAEDYDHLKGYNPDADLGLGAACPPSMPTSKRATPCWTLARARVTTALWPASAWAKPEKCWAWI